MFDASMNPTMLLTPPAIAIDLAYNCEFCIRLQPSINYAKHPFLCSTCNNSLVTNMNISIKNTTYNNVDIV